MRIPLSWLAEHVALPGDGSPAALHAALVRVGFEEEAVHGGAVTGPVVVGEVLELSPEPQKNGKTIRWCSVRVAREGATATDGGADVRGIVCGAANFAVGDRVVVTLPGAVLPGPFPIAARKTYGHVSDGMLASAKELGLGDGHDGILVLGELGIDAEVGTDAIALLGLDDAAVEINVTPDRGYALSMRGIAREVAASTGAAFRDPADAIVPPVGTDGGSVPVSVRDDAPLRGRPGVRVFATRVVRGIDPGAVTPRWMADRLRLVGIRSISLAVDVTNYVMLELGQPLHGYDLGAVRGGLGVRRATAGEILTTLDGQRRELSPEDLVIVDDSGAIGLAGVMGGGSTELSSTTTDVVIEAANFDPVSIGRTARRHRLPSEASRRFERGVDPAIAVVAAERAARLLVELAGGTAETAQVVFADMPAIPAIRLTETATERRVGVRYSSDEITDSLAAIGAEVRIADDGWDVVPPTWRSDLLEPADLVEEVARIVGYDRIPAVLPTAPPGRGLTRSQRLRRSVASALAASGAVEVRCYPFVSEARHAVLGAPEGVAPAVRIVNPLDATAPLLRRSLLPGLLETLRRNRGRGLVDLALFETGAVFLPEDGVPYGIAELPPLGAHPDPETLLRLETAIPPQPRHAAVVLSGDRVAKQPGRGSEPTDWRDGLAAARTIAAAVGVELDVEQGSHQALHPGRAARLLVRTADGVVGVGWAGELAPALAAELDVPGRVAVAELDVDALVRLSGLPVDTSPISGYPAATQDLSLVVAREVPAGAVQRAVVEGAGGLLEAIELVDDYRGAGVADDAKSLTFALRFRAADRTLTAKEATAAKEAGAALAADRHGAAIRE